MSEQAVKISTNGPDHAVIEVNGADVAHAVQAYNLAASAGNMTVLTLEMVALPHEFEGTALVRLPQIQHDALIALGWTPPTVLGEAVSRLDALDASDPEAAHDVADSILLAHVPSALCEAYERLVNRAPWWVTS